MPECDVKWALGSIIGTKLVGSFIIKVNLENLAMPTRLEKVTFHSKPKERQSQRIFKLLNIPHASKVMLKILQARLFHYVN